MENREGGREGCIIIRSDIYVLAILSGKVQGMTRESVVSTDKNSRREFPSHDDGANATSERTSHYDELIAQTILG